MSAASSMILIGVGTSGSAIARSACRAYGEEMRHVLVDTDAATGADDEPFLLIGGDRLAGHGAGGDFVAARMAAEDSVGMLDESLEGVRLAVIVAALGGGTGGGATLEIVRHLSVRGIPSIVFATLPFKFEGPDAERNASGVMALIEDAANATVFLPLDRLVGPVDNMGDALRRALDLAASGITLFWRLVGKPGYIRLDAERIRHLISGAGRGRFATVTTQGPNRANDVADALARSELLATGQAPVRSILCGVLAGEDLRLSELEALSGGIRETFGPTCAFELATVNDEATFCGRLSVVVLLFETGPQAKARAEATAAEGASAEVPPAHRRKRAKNPLNVGPTGRGRFNNAEQTIWNGEDLDVPTFIREGISLDF